MSNLIKFKKTFFKVWAKAILPLKWLIKSFQKIILSIGVIMFKGFKYLTRQSKLFYTFSFSLLLTLISIYFLVQYFWIYSEKDSPEVIQTSVFIDKLQRMNQGFPLRLHYRWGREIHTDLKDTVHGLLEDFYIDVVDSVIPKGKYEEDIKSVTKEIRTTYNDLIKDFEEDTIFEKTLYDTIYHNYTKGKLEAVMDGEVVLLYQDYKISDGKVIYETEVNVSSEYFSYFDTYDYLESIFVHDFIFAIDYSNEPTGIAEIIRYDDWDKKTGIRRTQLTPKECSEFEEDFLGIPTSNCGLFKIATDKIPFIFRYEIELHKNSNVYGKDKVAIVSDVLSEYFDNTNVVGNTISYEDYIDVDSYLPSNSFHKRYESFSIANVLVPKNLSEIEFLDEFEEKENRLSKVERGFFKLPLYPVPFFHNSSVIEYTNLSKIRRREFSLIIWTIILGIGLSGVFQSIFYSK